jgi:hypothetical protein
LIGAAFRFLRADRGSVWVGRRYEGVKNAVLRTVLKKPFSTFCDVFVNHFQFFEIIPKT